MEQTQYKASYIVLMVVLAFATLGLQIGLAFVPIIDSSNSNPLMVPTERNPFGGLMGTTVLPGCTVVWREEVWTCLANSAQQMPGQSQRPPSGRLVAIDLKTGKARDPGITISPAPVGLYVLDDQLWTVSETGVNRIENDEAITRIPRRGLVNPSKPFTFQGKLAVVDQNRSFATTLLTWDGLEWVEVGKEGLVDAPAINTMRGFSSEFRIISDGETLHSFYVDGQRISYRSGIVPSEERPVSALESENKLDPMRPAGPGLRGGTTLTIAINWYSEWEIALIDRELRIFSTNSTYGKSEIQCYQDKGGFWAATPSPKPVEAESFGVASGSPGYLVTSDLRLYSILGSTYQRVTGGIQRSDGDLFSINLFARLGLYLIPVGLLVCGTWRLMQTYRTSEYVFGKRHVVQASILRRALARGVDLLIMVFPSGFWLMVVVDSARELHQGVSRFGIVDNIAVVMLCSVFGMWFVILLAISYAEGVWGVTPGKWLFGIRTFRTTMRPCGILRALARELMIYADGLCLMTWLPGVLLIGFTPHWQRLGDLTADTIVVNDPKKPSYLVQGSAD